MSPYQSSGMTPKGQTMGWAIGWALLGALIALVLYAPALWVAHSLDRVTQGRLQLQEARGTIWNGSAHLRLSGGPGSKDQATLPGRVGWSIQPSIGPWRMMVFADCCTKEGIALTLHPGIEQLQLHVANQQSRIPASILSALGTPWNTIGLTGSISVQTQDLRLQWAHNRPSFTGSIQVGIAQAASRLSTVRPLGTYRVSIEGGQAPVLDVSTLEGALVLTGKGQWTGTQFRFNGEASASPEAEASLNNLLGIIGRRKGTRAIITLG